MTLKKIATCMATATMVLSMMATTTYADQWVKTDTGYVYEYDNGNTAAKGWLKVDGATYYITKDGTRKTGWLSTKAAKYYFDKNGKMYKSKWLTLKSGKKYYLTSNGKMATGVVIIGDVEYKFGDDGVCLGENNHFILNEDTLCLHSTLCTAAKKIDKENYAEIDIGEDELATYSKEKYWACGMSGCNSKDTREALPKPKK